MRKGDIIADIMVVRMRHTRGHTNNRRSHHALTTRQLSVCPECKSAIQSHKMCDVCGMYKGKVVIKKKVKATK
jgi:large subunit ribosomal protein L32